MTSCCPKGWIKFFKAAADENRQDILSVISKHQPINATDISKHIKLSQPTLSHHLSKLSNAGLIKTEKKGKEIFYQIDNKTINDCCLGFANKIK
jgi:DNA-binding transcriptional ArsR family regulator